MARARTAARISSTAWLAVDRSPSKTRGSAGGPSPASSFVTPTPTSRTPADTSTSASRRRAIGQDHAAVVGGLGQGRGAGDGLGSPRVADLEADGPTPAGWRPAAGPPPSRPCARAPVGTARGRGRSTANVSSWLIDFVATVGDRPAGRRSPLASACRCRPTASPTRPRRRVDREAARSPTVARRGGASLASGGRADAPQRLDRAAGGGSPSTSPGATTNTPRPNTGPGRRRRRLGLPRWPSLARNLSAATPDRAGEADLVERRRPRIGAAIAGAGPSARSDPVTSRNASSSDSGSTSGVTRRRSPSPRG